MTTRLAIATAVVAALVQPPGTQVATSSTELLGAVRLLALSVEALPANLRSTRLSDATRWLQNNVGNTRAENVSQEYVRSLERAAAVLAAQPPPAVVDDVAR